MYNFNIVLCTCVGNLKYIPNLIFYYNHFIFSMLIPPDEVFNSSLHEQNGCHFPDDIFRCIFANEKLCISIQISLKFIPKGTIDNKSALVQVMAWHPTGDNALPEPMLTQFIDTYMWHQEEMSWYKLWGLAIIAILLSFNIDLNGEFWLWFVEASSLMVWPISFIFCQFA